MNNKKIPFNIPYVTGDEIKNINQTLIDRKLSGNYKFTEKVHNFFKDKYNFKKVLLTTSCTDALEMAAILSNIKEGDEVIIPSFTFVSTANAFVLRGAKIIFADSNEKEPNINADSIEELITAKTKAIVVVHYAGVACDMTKILELSKKHNLFVIEDAAQAIDSYYLDQPLGSLGHFGTFSFHETKNIICGEGGLLAVNDDTYNNRSEIIWEKGTNRSAFFRGEVDKYGWVDLGSSFLLSEINASFLYAQLNQIDDIQTKRKQIWNQYYEQLQNLQKTEKINLPFIPDYATNNAHMFYIICKDLNERSGLIKFLKNENIHAVFHYQSLHTSLYYKDKNQQSLPNSDKFTNRLLRLPFYYELSLDEVDKISQTIINFYYQQ